MIPSVWVRELRPAAAVPAGTMVIPECGNRGWPGRAAVLLEGWAGYRDDLHQQHRIMVATRCAVTSGWGMGGWYVRGSDLLLTVRPWSGGAA